MIGLVLQWFGRRPDGMKCLRCGGPRERTDRQACNRCLAVGRMKAQTRKLARLAAGVCVNCGKQGRQIAPTSRNFCRKCLRAHRLRCRARA